MSRVPTAAVAALSLIAGFAMAEVTGQRWLGGLVLAAALLMCVPRWWRTGGLALAVGLTVTYAAAFALSHVIAGTVGAWPSVLLAAAIVAAAVWSFGDRQALPAR